jgi:hypothetical protein
MRLSKPVALLVLGATLLPLAHLVFFFVTILVALAGGLWGESGAAWFTALFVVHFLCIVWIWALLAFYLVFLFRSDAVPKDQKVLWAVVLFFGNMFAMPVFWFLYIWRPVTAGVPRAPAEPVAAADRGPVSE